MTNSFLVQYFFVRTALYRTKPPISKQERTFGSNIQPTSNLSNPPEHAGHVLPALVHAQAIAPVGTERAFTSVGLWPFQYSPQGQAVASGGNRGPTAVLREARTAERRPSGCGASPTLREYPETLMTAPSCSPAHARTFELMCLAESGCHACVLHNDVS